MCLECVRWIATLTTLTNHHLQLIAWERGESQATTRAAVLAAYHAQHMED